MSVFQFTGGTGSLLAKKIIGNTATVIIDAAGAMTGGAIFVPWFRVGENSGATPNLTVELYDLQNTTSYYLGDDGGAVWKAKAVTAYQSIAFTDGYIVPGGWQLRVTSSDPAGKFDITGITGR